MNYGAFAREMRGLDELELGYLKEVLERGKLTGLFNEEGLVSQFQKAFAEYTGAKIALARNNVPVMNMLISQEGAVSAKTLELFAAVRKELKG